MFEYDLSAYLSVFLDEADEQLQILNEKILVLEKDPFNVEVVQSIFRAAHTLKGSSASMGFDKLKEFTHQLENVFEQIRQQRLEVTAHLINVLFESIDLIGQMKEAIISNELNKIDISNGLANLAYFLEESLTVNDAVTNSQSLEVTLESHHQQVLQHGIAENLHALMIHIQLKADTMMKNVRAFMIHNALNECSDIIATAPTVEVMEQDEQFSGEMKFCILTATNEETLLHKLSMIADIESINCHVIDAEKEQETSAQTAVKELDSVDMASKISPTIRVDIDKLEHLMGLVGELVINQTRLVDVRGRFSEKEIRHEREFDVLNEVTNQLSLVISELQDGMMKTRMLPIEQLFNRFPRLVRDTSLKAGKEIDFQVFGKETELDRTLIEEISDPLIHLIRNAIDHGIESAEERIQFGKEAKGHVTVSAAYEEKHVVIKIQDDGRGIDPEKIKQASVAKGIITQEVANKLNDKEAMFLIFKSGISTAEKITEISGRGVGMDIVKSHIEKINGIIDIDSTVGQGTTFTIKLPLTLTLSIIRALLVKFGEKIYAIPLVNVLEIIRINTQDIQTIKDQEVGLVRGRVLPLIRMKEKLNIEGHETTAAKNREFVVVVGFADKRVGIVVDKTLGNQEIVKKSLGSYIGSPPFISGATIMGDANVALILDVAEIVKEFGAPIDELQDVVTKKTANEVNQLVTFKLQDEEYGIDIQEAKDIIPFTKVTRLVDAPENILGVINLRGKTLQVMDLRERLHLTKAVYTKKARIIVVEHQQQEIGFVVDEVTQVFKSEDIEVEMQHEHSASKLVKSISKMNGRMILNLNLDELFKKVF